jgi:acetylornithine deacetylase
VEKAVAVAAAGLPGFDASVQYEGFACEGYTLEPSAAPLQPLSEACERVIGSVPATFASTATTDARTFELYGASPAVCFGPHAENVHSVDERVHLPTITQTAQALGLFIAAWCGLGS